MTRKEIYILVGIFLLGVCAVGVLLTGIFLIASRSAGQLEPIPEVISVVTDPRPNANGSSMGDPNAPIMIDEFSDFQCPYCQHFHEETETLLVEQYVSTGKVYFTYHSMDNFISQNLGGGKTESQDAARAAYCAGDQNKFWEMHAYLFANVLGEDAGSFTDRRIKVIAEKAGLDMDQFNSCYDSGNYENRVQQDLEDGRAANVAGVPSFLVTYSINGEKKTRLIEGAQPFSVFQQELDAVLEEMDIQ